MTKAYLSPDLSAQMVVDVASSERCEERICGKLVGDLVQWVYYPSYGLLRDSRLARSERCIFY